MCRHIGGGTAARFHDKALDALSTLMSGGAAGCVLCGKEWRELNKLAGGGDYPMYTKIMHNKPDNPNENQILKLLYRVSAVMAATDYSRSTIYKAIKDGTLPVVSLNRSIRIPAAALLRWIEEQTNA